MDGALPVGERRRRIPQSAGPTLTMADSKEYPQKTSGSFPSLDWKRKRPTTPSAAFSIWPASKSKTSGCLIQNSEEQKQQRSESRVNIVRRPKTSQFGHFTAKSETGNSAEKRPSHPSNSPFILFWRFCFFFLFAAAKRQITIGSHNLHSFKQSAAYHKECLNKHGGIWFGQELWLSEKQLPTLNQLGTQFVARSGMEQAVSDGLLVGRPFGGVSISWSPDLNHLIMPLTNFNHKRIVGIELKSRQAPTLFINIYMPFFNSSRRAECLAESVDAIAMIDSIIEEHPNHLIIIGGDFNSELKGASPFDRHWQDFAQKNRLAFCSSRFPANSITYHHKSLDQKKWIDHFLVSPALLESHLSCFTILDEGQNLSDHLPILMKMSIYDEAADEPPQRTASQETLNWKNLNPSHVDAYTARLSMLVDALPEPEVTSHCHTSCICENASCLQSAQKEYDLLIQCLQVADSTLPRHKPGISKDWWTEGLDELKKKSIEIHSTWKNAGRPRHGAIHEERLRVRAAYKSTLEKHNVHRNKLRGIGFTRHCHKMIPILFGSHGGVCIIQTKVIYPL